MECGRINRHYRSRGGSNQNRSKRGGINQTRTLLKPKLCVRCFEMGHWRGPNCKSINPNMACGKCFRMNFFAIDCPHCAKNPTVGVKDGMTLRLCGQVQPRLFIDVIFGGKTFPALINTSIYRSRINLEALAIINEERRHANLSKIRPSGLINYTIRRRRRELNLSFVIKPNQREMVIVGMDFLFKTGFSLTIDRVTITQRSAVTKSPTTIDFLYNRPQGSQLFNWMEIMNYPMYHPYERDSVPILKEMPEVTISNEYYHSEEDEVEDDESEQDIIDINLDDEDRKMVEN